MVRHFWCWTLVAFVVPCWSADSTGDISPGNPVAVLTDSNFDQALELMNADQEKVWIVEFYAPWCTHCQKFAAVYDQAAKTVSQFRFAKMDAEANANTRKKYHIKSYPSIRWVRDGRFHAYHGEQTVEGFKDLAEKLSSPPIKWINRYTDFETMDKEHDVWFLFGHLGTSEGGTIVEAMKTYEEVARTFQDHLHFAVSNDPSVLAKLKTGGASQTVAKFHGHGKEDPVEFNVDDAVFMGMTHEQRVEKLSAWVNDLKLPLVSMLSPATLKYASRNGRMLCLAIVGTDEDAQAYKEGLLGFARPSSVLEEEVLQKYYFGVMDGRGVDRDKYFASYGVDVKKLPHVLVFNSIVGQQDQYFNERIQALDDVPAFLRGISNGTIAARREDFWELYQMLWLQAKIQLPLLELADPLPQFSLTAVIGLLVIYCMMRG